jgi:hypothetical protein
VKEGRVGIATYRQAAQAINRSSSAIEAWVRTGVLTPPPWTTNQLTKAMQRVESHGGRENITSPHGTENRWRTGCPCDLCRAAHSNASKEQRRTASLARIAPQRKRVLDILGSGGTFEDVKKETGLAPQALHGVAKFDAEWKGELDDALTRGRRTDLDHGTHMAWKAGCRCPECREFHRTGSRR